LARISLNIAGVAYRVSFGIFILSYFLYEHVCSSVASVDENLQELVTCGQKHWLMGSGDGNPLVLEGILIQGLHWSFKD